MRSLAGLVGFGGLVALAAFFGARFEPGAWYVGLRKPPLTPPSPVFAPVWTVLYLAIAVAAWLVWKAPRRSVSPLALWTGQLVLNAAWSFLFFGLQRPGLALVDLAALVVVAALTAASFLRVRPLAAALFAPYVAWVGFALYLNAGLWWLNRPGAAP